MRDQDDGVGRMAEAKGGAEMLAADAVGRGGRAWEGEFGPPLQKANGGRASTASPTTGDERKRLEASGLKT